MINNTYLFCLICLLKSLYIYFSLQYINHEYTKICLIGNVHMWNLGQGRGDDHLVDGVTTISLIGEVAVVVVPGFDF